MSGTGGTFATGELHALADLLANLTPGALPVDHLDQLEALERVKSAAAAAQAVVTATFADAAARDVDRSRGALATLSSPYAGEQRVLLSRRLRDHLPLTLAALQRGELTEDRAFAVAREVGHLTPEQRSRVDGDLAPRLAGLGDVRLRDAVRRSCLTRAAESETRRCRRARADRRVTSRALDDGTGRPTAILPLESLAAVRASLDAEAAAARAAGDPRTAGQVRADTLAARITGRDAARAAPPGPPSGDSSSPPPIGRWSRWSPPAAGSTDCSQSSSTSRLRPVPHARLQRADPPSRPRHPRRGQGVTAAANGQGLCERCNYVKESPGWTSWVADPGDAGLHEVHGVTEHLRMLRSTSPPAPGGGAGSVDYSPLELQLASNVTLAS